MRTITYSVLKDRKIMIVTILVTRLEIGNINQVTNQIVDSWKKLKGNYHILIDCCNVKNVDSTTIGVVLSRYMKMKKAKLKLCLFNLNDHIKSMKNITIKNVLIKSFDSKDEAIDWIVRNDTE